MSQIKGKNTSIELIVRKGLHARGLRYRLHSDNMPGRPDIVLPKYSAVIFVNGCFWHAHDCGLFRIPQTNTDFWTNKILKNIENDKKYLSKLNNAGWRVLYVWECSIKGCNRNIEKLIDCIISWLDSDQIRGEISRKTLNI